MLVLLLAVGAIASTAGSNPAWPPGGSRAAAEPRLHKTEAATPQSSRGKEALTLRFGKTPIFEAKLLWLGDTGLIWIENQPTGNTRISYTEVIDDFSFEPYRLLSYQVSGSPDSWVVFAEYYHTSWVYARFFLISKSGITEPLAFAHRDPDSISLVLDRHGRLAEVVLRDRWTGRRPYSDDPEMRWWLHTRYRVRDSKPWTLVDERWKLAKW